MSARGKIHGAYGGYSPKLYDAHWVQANKHFLEHNYRGAHIIADQYFHSAGTIMGVRFLTTDPPASRCNFDTVDQWNAHEEKRKRANREIASLRARVEGIFGLLSNKFNALGNKFGDSAEQTDYLVSYASAVHNFDF